MSKIFPLAHIWKRMTEEPICQATLLGRIFHHIIQKTMDVYL